MAFKMFTVKNFLILIIQQFLLPVIYIYVFTLCFLFQEYVMDNLNSMIPVGALFKVFYTDSDTLQNYQDVHFISESGKMHSVNRCVLACNSQVCCDLLQTLYACPIANADDKIHVSTNLSDNELETMMSFFTQGFLPTLPGGEEVDFKSAQVFQAFGINLRYLSDTTRDVDVKDVKLDVNELDSNFDANIDCDVELTENYSSRHKRKIPSFDEFDDEEDFEDEEDEKTSGKVRKIKAKYEKCSKKGRSGPLLPGPARNWYFYFPQDGERDLNNPYQCERCTRSFRSLPDYRQHFLRHDMETQDYGKAFTCLRCFNFTASKESIINNHGKNECPVKAHYDDDSCFTYFCIYCPQGQRFRLVNDWSRHMSREHAEEEKKLFHSFVCAACGKGWRAAFTVMKHKKFEGIYHRDECVHCGLEVKTWDDHKKHLDEVHGGVFKWKCGLCGVCVFDTEQEKINHRKFCKILGSTGQVQTPTDSNKTSCPLCGEAVEVTGHAVRQHLIDYHADKQLMCPMCNQVFFEEQALKVHVVKRHTGERFDCDLCEKNFPSKYLLKVHKIRQHASKDKLPFQCEECGLKFMFQGELSYHMKKKHDPNRAELQKKRMCEICGTSMSLSGFVKHMQRKHGDANIKCEKCDQTFKHEKIYRHHIANVHTYTTCEECGQQVKANFYRAHKLKHHTPDALKPFVCKICTKGFINKQLFGEHMNIHTGDRPFRCDFCSKTFTNTGNKRKHIRESHREEEMMKKQGLSVALNGN